MQSLSDCLSSEETTLANLEQRVTALETLQESHVDSVVALQLHLEDLEGGSRLKNLRLWGFHEATATENLPDMALATLHKILGDSPPTNLEFVWIHRAPQITIDSMM